jgi:hypothetical protein
MNALSRFITVTLVSPAIAVAAHQLLPSIPVDLTASGGSLAMSVAGTRASLAPRIERLASGDDGINPQPLPPGRRS